MEVRKIKYLKRIMNGLREVVVGVVMGGVVGSVVGLLVRALVVVGKGLKQVVMWTARSLVVGGIKLYWCI